jgi:hypothetical protein
VAELDVLAGANRGFRASYLDYQTLTEQMRTWAALFPNLVRLESIGKSEEGRDLWLLIVGRDPDRKQPAIWIDGNMHASELCGSSVALAIAEDAIRLHLDPHATLHGLPPHVGESLRHVLFYILPRMSPDGAEAVLTSGRYVRSVPRDRRLNRGHARWISGDVDGDGRISMMRKEDPTGEFVESKNVRGLLVPRELEDAGPFYKLFPEGSIENFDGSTIPTPSYLSDNEPDFNRNFPYHWAPEPEQFGAGAFPGSEPECRAVIEAASKAPNIFAWFNLHTFGGVFIRPLGDKPDSKMDQFDLAIFRQLGAWAEELAGYPTVSGFEEFTYEPDKPLLGDITDFAYHQRGALAWACELWDLFRQAGIPKKKKFVDYYTHLTRSEMEQIGRWDAEHNASRVIRPWRKFTHPQLGEVELGGLDPRFGWWNPPPDLLGDVCTKISAIAVRVAALAPRVVITTNQTAIEGLTRVDVTVENHGYLPTYVLPSAKALPWNEPLHLDVRADGCALTSPADAHREIGHLDGWGRGLFDGTSALYYAKSRGSTSKQTLSFVVRGHGVLTLRAGSCRVGFIEKRVEVV